MKSIALLVMIPGLCHAAPEYAEGAKIERSTSASLDGTVTVELISGEVKVLGHDLATVNLTGWIGKGTERVVFEGGGDKTLIRVELPKHGHNVEGSRLEIRVPKNSRLQIKTVSADLGVRGLSAIDAESISGDIDIEGQGARVRGKTVSGNFTLALSRGDLELESVSGDVRIMSAKIAALELKTVSGDIEVKGLFEPSARHRASTHSGDVDIVLPKGSSGTFSLRSFSGELDVENGVPAAGEGKSRKVSLGSGGPEVELSTFSGDVRVRDG